MLRAFILLFLTSYSMVTPSFRVCGVLWAWTTVCSDGLLYYGNQKNEIKCVFYFNVWQTKEDSSNLDLLTVVLY